jgi:hypothetical protein
MSDQIGLASEAYVLFAGATKIPCLNPPSERVAVAPPAGGEVPELLLQPSGRWRNRVARAPLRVLFSHKNFANLVGDSRPGVSEHLIEREGKQLTVRQDRQLAVCVDQPGVSTNTSVV